MLKFFRKAFKKEGGEDSAEEVPQNVEEKPYEQRTADEKPLEAVAPTSHPSGETYSVKPLDLVLFQGIDPVANVIKSIERKYVVPDLRAPFTALWTHAGIVVDKSILGYDWMEENTLYIYESVFSGEVAGYKYSSFLPLDTDNTDKKCHLGPQIRKLWDVVNESAGDTAVCALTPEVRAKLVGKEHIVKDFHQQYLGAGYPLSILPQLGAASEGLFDALEAIKKIFPSEEVNKKMVFCSELTALIYARLGVKEFTDEKAAQLTPLELEVMDVFDGHCHYVKRKGQLLVHEDGHTIPVYRTEDEVRDLSGANLKWVQMDDDGPQPNLPDIQAAGADVKGAPLYIARAAIGRSVHPGKASDDLKKAWIPWDGIELEMHVRHEVLASLDGTAWVAAKAGEIPEKAIVAGFEETGENLYIARGEIKVDKWFKDDLVSLCLGKTGLHTNGALMPFHGEEVRIKEGYEVLVEA
ncbi:hypothetical protein HDV00_003195 [Rhizophlyctis rosea]|nr:hypothetical protein HDV00_003195 [Rhizophlyctis rosea]